jgi:DNA-directed RNA polymerase subunit RPC12/RpoP
MPIDQHDDGDDTLEGADLGRSRRFADFDCPDCNANNPHDDSFGDGDEVRCAYCGQEFRAQVNESGRLKLKEA